MIDHDIAAGPLDHCQICGSEDLQVVIDCGHQPLCDTLLSEADLMRPEKTYPLQLNRCRKCSNAQLNYVVPGEEVYFPDYPYKSGVTRELREYQSAMSRKLIDALSLDSGALVVDVGCNDGTLLSGFKENGMRVLGIEPTNIAKYAEEAGIETIQSFFTENVADDILAEHGKVSLVTATNVFAHMAPLGEVCRGIRKLIGDLGVFVLENHYLDDVIQRNQYDTVYHEHIRTYCLKSLMTLFDFYDLEVFRAERVSRYGGNIRAFVAKRGTRTVESSVGEMQKAEAAVGLHEADTYTAFRQRCETSRDQLLELAVNSHAKGELLVGKACPGRCVTLLNFCDIGKHLMPYITEQSASLKLGKYLPGKQIPIVDDSVLLKDQPDVIVILAWHYGPAIARQIRDMGLKSKLVLPLPELAVFEGDKLPS